MFTINTKHHRTGKLRLHGDDLVLNGRSTDHVPKARREAERAAAALHGPGPATAGAARPGRLVCPVRPVVVIVGGRLTVRTWSEGVTVIMAEQLLHTLRAFRPGVDADEVERLYALAHQSTTWTQERAAP